MRAELVGRAEKEECGQKLRQGINWGENRKSRVGIEEEEQKWKKEEWETGEGEEVGMGEEDQEKAEDMR